MEPIGNFFLVPRPIFERVSYQQSHAILQSIVAYRTESNPSLLTENSDSVGEVNIPSLVIEGVPVLWKLVD